MDQNDFEIVAVIRAEPPFFDDTGNEVTLFPPDKVNILYHIKCPDGRMAVIAIGIPLAVMEDTEFDESIYHAAAIQAAMDLVEREPKK